jgi:GDPmannose 4,6-dehydratase
MSIVASNFNNTHCLLSSIKELVPACKFYFTGSSEMFGDADSSPQTEETRFNPRSIYGIAKLASYHLVKRYRDQYGIFACTGIAYNHESPRRGHAFVTRKITSTAAKIYLGLATELELGSLDAVRDWGYAPEFIEAMWRMLNLAKEPRDYVICTGLTHTVRDVLQVAFATLNLDYRQYVKVNKDFVRPPERIVLTGKYDKIKQDLGWEPTKKFEDMITEMVYHDLNLLRGRFSNS